MLRPAQRGFDKLSIVRSSAEAHSKPLPNPLTPMPSGCVIGGTLCAMINFHGQGVDLSTPTLRERWRASVGGGNGLR